MQFEIKASGHHNISGSHKSTWQLTTEDHVTPTGDCIIAINATASAVNVPQWLQDHLKQGGLISISLCQGSSTYQGTAKGHPDLSFRHKTDMVFRKSNYVCERTIAINCDFSARDIPRELLPTTDNELLSIILSPLDSVK